VRRGRACYRFLASTSQYRGSMLKRPDWRFARRFRPRWTRLSSSEGLGSSPYGWFVQGDIARRHGPGGKHGLSGGTPHRPSDSYREMLSVGARRELFEISTGNMLVPRQQLQRCAASSMSCIPLAWLRPGKHVWSQHRRCKLHMREFSDAY